jgi:CRISPR/Cas system-associated endoribonuclease Cas2
MKINNSHVRQYVKNRLIDHIKAKQDCNLEWVKRKIRNSELKPVDLEEIFSELKEFENNSRFKIILEICRKTQFISKRII